MIYEIGVTINYVHRTNCKFSDGDMRKAKYKGEPITFGLDLVQSQHPNAVIEFDYIKEYDNVVD